MKSKEKQYMKSAIQQVNMIRGSYSHGYKNEFDILRDKYSDAGIAALNYIYESGAIEVYDKFLERQQPENVLNSYTAPNGLKYELNDIKGLESLGIYDREEQISYLSSLGKYKYTEDWSNRLPNLLYLDFNSLKDLRYTDEKYKFELTMRKPKIKDIQSTMFDQVQLYIYKKTTSDQTDWSDKDKVAITSYYYLSPTRHLRRYTSIFRVEENNLIEYPDWNHIEDYNTDMGTVYRF